MWLRSCDPSNSAPPSFAIPQADKPESHFTFVCLCVVPIASSGSFTQLNLLVLSLLRVRIMESK